MLGVGRSGLSAYRSLEACGARVRAWDDDVERRQSALEDGLLLSDPTLPGTFADLDAVVVSPGVPHLYPRPSPSVALALEAGVPLDNDIGLFFAALRNRRQTSEGSPPQVIAVTGSNGKSTTSALINHVLNCSGRSSSVAGNIGNAVLDLPEIEGFVVLEVSSYQAELAKCLDPDIAVFLKPFPRPSRQARWSGRVFRRQGAPFRRQVAQGRCGRHRRSGGQVSGKPRAGTARAERNLHGFGFRSADSGRFRHNLPGPKTFGVQMRA